MKVIKLTETNISELTEILENLNCKNLHLYWTILEQKDKKEKELNTAQKKVIFSDAGNYVRDNSKYIIKPGNVFCITVNTLIEEDYISMSADDFKDNTVKVTVDENENFVYSIDNKCSENIES